MRRNMMKAAGGGDVPFVDPRDGKVDLLVNTNIGDADVIQTLNQLRPDGVLLDGIKLTSLAANASAATLQKRYTNGQLYAIGGYFKGDIPADVRFAMGNSSSQNLPDSGIYGSYPDGVQVGNTSEWTLLEFQFTPHSISTMYLWVGLFNTFSTGEEFYYSRLMMYEGVKVT